MSRGFASNYRIVLLATGMLLCFGGVAVRLVDLHVWRRAELLKYVEQARRSFVVENARRGNIRDARGEILATSRTFIDVGLDPHMLRPEDAARWPDLARLLGVTVADIRAAAARRFVDPPGDDGRDPKPVQWVKLAEGVDEATYDRISALQIRGVYGNRVYRRFYPYNSLAAQVLGYVNRDGVPAAGVERYMDFFLRGENGWRESERNGRRQELAQFQTREVPPINGYDVTLSIDMYIQHMIEAELQLIAAKYAPEKATIIVSDARTGFLLGLANYPTFNLNEFNRAPLEALRNYAVTDVFEPGSTFKIVAISGALNERLVTPGSAFDVGANEVDYQGRHLRLPRDDHPAQILSVAEIISHSSNRGAAQLAMLMGDQRFYGYIRAFGFGEKTGFPFGGEVDGLLDPPKAWDRLTITRMPMGQAIGVTPMQIHYAMAAIASGGVLLHPQLFREVRDEKGDLVFAFGELPHRRVIDESIAGTMARLLEGVASPGGTAPEAAIPHYEVAGKTGTSQKYIDGRPSDRHHVASFVGFFPASRPRVVISVIIDDADARCPGGVAYGSKVAAPSFKHIGEQLIQYLDIKPVTELPASRFAALAPARSGQGGGW
jgi:cell division protein FtsI (penicillin-binding protein 3)/stage V sporulation protein D (sporulation-specific penicillin-binding protein)